jgi:hypothetical protein
MRVVPGTLSDTRPGKIGNPGPGVDVPYGKGMLVSVKTRIIKQNATITMLKFILDSIQRSSHSFSAAPGGWAADIS